MRLHNSSLILNVGQAVALLAGLMLNCSAKAGYWFWEPRVSAYVDYHTNMTLNSVEADPVTRETVEATAKMGFQSERSQYLFNTGFTERVVQGLDDYDTRDLSFSLSAVHQYTENDLFSIGFSVSSDSTLTSEAGLFGTGRVQDRKARTMLVINPSWTHTISELDSVSFRLSMSDVRYEDEALIPLSDYRYYVAAGSYSRQIMETLGLSADVSYSQYQSSGVEYIGFVHPYNRVESETDNSTLTGLIGANWEVDERNLLSMSVGMAKVSSNQRETYFMAARRSENSDSGLRYNINYRNSGERNTLSVLFSRAESPDGSGELRVTDALTFQWNRQFSDRLDMTFRVEHGTTQSDSVADRSYRSLDLVVSRLLQEHLTLNAKFRHVQQSYAGSDSVQNNILQLSIHKRWTEMPLH